MAEPLPHNNSNILYVDYNSQGNNHTVMFRYPAPAAEPGSDFLEGVDEFLAAAAVYMPTNCFFVGSRVQLAGTDVSYPVVFTPSDMSGSGSPSTAEKPAYFSLVGRDSEGHATRITMLGSAASPANEGDAFSKYRLVEGDTTAGDAIIAAVIGIGACTINNITPVWKHYINFGYNAHFQKKTRRG